MFMTQLLLTAAAQPFIWSENLSKVVTTALLSMVPAFEGRYAVNVGLAVGMPLAFTFVLAFCFSTLPLPFIFWLLKPILKWFYTLPYRPVQRFAAWVENRAARKAKEMGKAGMLALFLFVAVPLPGTGVWTGSAIATLLGMDVKKSMLAVVLGNLAACTIMTLAGYGVSSILAWFGA